MYTLPIFELLQDAHDPPMTPERLADLQRELCATFPQEYADFLLQINGGDFCRPVMFYLPNPTQWINEVAVDWFYGDPDDPQYGGSLRLYARLLNERIPDDCQLRWR